MAAESDGLPNHWDIRRLDQVATIVDSLHKTPTYSDAGRPMIRVIDVQGGFLKTADALRVSDDVFDEFTRRYKPKRGDIVFSRVGSYGNASYVNTDEGFCLGQNTALLSPRINGRFLHLFLQSADARRQIDELAVGSTQKTVSLKSIAALQIPVPPRDELEAIAAVLGALDDKIELNRRMNATLEAMAQTLFQSWFVDFDPVRTELDGRKPAGLDSATAALFPNEFEDWELGPIPKDWRVGKIHDILTFSRSTVDPSETPNDLFAHYSLPAFDEGRTPKIEPGSEIKSQKLAVPPDAALLSKLNPHIPRIWFPDVSGDARAVCSTEFLVAAAKPGFSREFLFCLFTSNQFGTEYATLVTGTTGSHQRVKGESVLEIKLVVPPTEIVERFSSIVIPIFQKVALQIRESTTLATIRDALVPRLLNGELRVNKNLSD
jgi:type I restriction enzyme, S subunit